MRLTGRFLVLLFAVLNALLYCSLLPLWEGFDEPFHYAYVEELSINHHLPVLGKSTVSREIAESLSATPLSFILKRSVPNTFAFEDWFLLSAQKRVELKSKLLGIGNEKRRQPSTLLNYEAQQAPLAYLAAAPFDSLWAGFSLPARIFALRLLLSFAATILIWLGCYRLCEELGLIEPYRSLAVAVFLQCQIVMAAVAHVANDWLSIAAAVWFFVMLACLVRRPKAAYAIALGVVTAIGLLAKAYFLSFCPIYFLALFYAKVRLRLSARAVITSLAATAIVAGPWYLRNLLLYRSVAGMQENVRGVSLPEVLRAFTHIDWWDSFVKSARWSLWTGNETHLAFSQATLNIELLLFAAGFGLLLLKWRSLRSVEGWLAGGVLVFTAALAYDLCVTWVDTQGLQTTTGPYYAPCILPEIIAFVCLGFQRNALLGKVMAVIICLISTWIAALTYLAKLIPYYGGWVGRGTFPALWKWWTHQPQSGLFATTLAPVPAVMIFLVCTLMSLGVLATFLLRQLSGNRNSL